MGNLTAAIDLLRHELHASWLRLLDCPGDDFTRTVAAHRDARDLLDNAYDDAVELGQSRSALDAIRACIAAARDTSLDVPDEEDISEPIGHDETRETVVDVRGLVVLLRNATHPAANALAGDASQRADLAADVARLERALADRTRERDAAHRLAVEGAATRQQLISDLAIARGENDRLRAQLDDARDERRAYGSAVGAMAAGRTPDFATLADRLDGCALNALRRVAAQLDHQAAHRASGDAVDLARYVLRSEVVAALRDDAASSDRAAGIARPSETASSAYRSCANATRVIAERFELPLVTRDLRDGREDDHADHAAAFRRLTALALRGAAAAMRRAAGGSR